MLGRKTVLVLTGGGMAGAFGAGVVTGLQHAEAYSKIKVVIGSSSGTYNAAYFLSRQTDLGSRIYWEDLPKGFIKFRRLASDGQVMDMEYDKEADAAYIYLEYPIKNGSVKKTTSLNPNINLDYDAKGKLLGIEVLSASKALSKKALEGAKQIA